MFLSFCCTSFILAKSISVPSTHGVDGEMAKPLWTSINKCCRAQHYWDTSWTQCFKKQTELSCCGSYRLSGYLERNDSQATQERSHLLFPGQSRSQKVLQHVCYPFIYFRIISEHWRPLKGLWPGDWRPFWGEMEAIMVQKTSKYFTTEFYLEEGF